MGIGIELGVILAYVLGLILLYFVGWLLIIPIKVVGKLFINAIIGAALLIVVNIIGSFINFSIGINPATALIVGFLGVPGLLLLIVLKLIL